LVSLSSVVDLLRSAVEHAPHTTGPLKPSIPDPLASIVRLVRSIFRATESSITSGNVPVSKKCGPKKSPGLNEPPRLLWTQVFRYPLTANTALITHIFLALESLIAGLGFLPRLSSLSSLNSHIFYSGTKTGRGSKRKLRCQCPQKGKKDRILSNFTKIEDTRTA
jgi:hypothetical protein